MKRRKTYFFILLVLLTALVFSCNEKFNDEGTRYNNSNFPAVGNTVNAFAFAVTANNFSFSEKYPVTFNSGSIILGLTVTNLRRGTGHLDFINAGDTVYYSVPLSNNLAYGNVEITGGTPRWIKINLIDYTGQVSIGVSAK